MKGSWVIALVFILSGCKKDFTELDTLVLSHAGESIYHKQNQYPPNSLEGIIHVLQETRVEAIEIDVQMTADNQLVLWHDQKLDENSDFTGCISNYSFVELADAKVYGTNYSIASLEKVLQAAGTANITLLLDVKHYNFCSESKIDYNEFNNALNLELVDLTELQKEKVIVNCRDVQLLYALTDSSIQKSIETDNIDFAEVIFQSTDIDIAFIKLDEFNDAWLKMINENQVKFGLYNLNNRSKVNKALSFAPDFVISDQLEYTLNEVYGKE